jgi:hypothetical protein
MTCAQPAGSDIAAIAESGESSLRGPVHAELPPSTQQSTKRCRISVLACNTPATAFAVAAKAH